MVNIKELCQKVLGEKYAEIPEGLIDEVTDLEDASGLASALGVLRKATDQEILVAACAQVVSEDGASAVTDWLCHGGHVEEFWCEVGSLNDSCASDGGASEHILQRAESLFDGIEGMEREHAGVMVAVGPVTHRLHYAADRALDWLAEALDSLGTEAVTHNGATYRPLPDIDSEYCHVALRCQPLAQRALRRLRRVGAIVEGRK